MMTLPRDYEVRFQRPNGCLSILMFLQAASDRDAQTQDLQMLRGGLSRASVWRNGVFVASLHSIGVR
jgi:hypothetical protein